MGSEALILLIIAGIVFAGMPLLISKLIAPSSTNEQKAETYECGIPTIVSSQIQYKIGYYLFALVFLVFDVEVAFLFPWAVVVKDIGMVALVEIFIFLFILFLGLIYAWKKGALEWA